MSAGVDLDGVCADFGIFRAVDHVTVHIKPGEFFSFLGPSGCGKTTIFAWSPASSGRRRQNHHWRQGYARHPAEPAADRADLPESGAVSVDAGLGKHRLRARGARRRQEGAAGEGRGTSAPGRPAGGRGQGDQPALRRAEAACRNRPCARRRAEGDAARRAAVGARPEAAPAHARRAARHPEAHQRHLHLHHPRPGRGAGHVRPRRRDVAGPAAAGGRAAGNLQQAGQWFRRVVRRRKQHLRRQDRQHLRQLAQFETSVGTFKATMGPDAGTAVNAKLYVRPEHARLVPKRSMARTHAVEIADVAFEGNFISIQAPTCARRHSRRGSPQRRPGARCRRRARSCTWSSTPSAPSFWPTRRRPRSRP